MTKLFQSYFAGNTVALAAAAVAGTVGAGVCGWLVGWLGLRGTRVLAGSLTACCAYASAVGGGLTALPWLLRASALMVTAPGRFHLIPCAGARRPNHRSAGPQTNHPTQPVEETS